MGHSQREWARKQKEEKDRLAKFRHEHPEEFDAMMDRIRRRNSGEEVLEQVPQYFTGWRGWYIASTVDGIRLMSFNHTLWAPYEKMTAVCNNDRHPDRAPHHRKDGCKSGLYAVKQAYRSIVGEIYGQVNLWGKFDEGDFGYRSEFAYPNSFEWFICSSCRSNISTEDLAGTSVYQGDSTKYEIVHPRCASCTDKTTFILFPKIPLSMVYDSLMETYGMNDQPQTLESFLEEEL